MAGLADIGAVNSTGLNANAEGGSDRVSNFVTVQSFGTFAVASAVLKTIWDLIKHLGGGWSKSYWTPVVMALLYGVWQFAQSVVGANRVKGAMNIISAAVIAAVNSGVLATAIIGFTETTGVGEPSK